MTTPPDLGTTTNSSIVDPPVSFTESIPGSPSVTDQIIQTGTDSILTTMDAGIETSTKNLLTTTDAIIIETKTENIVTTIADTVTSTVKNIVTSVTSNLETVTPTITENNFNLIENVNSNSTLFNTNNNSTAFSEMFGSNSTMQDNNGTSLLSNVTAEPDVVTGTIKDDFFTTTTENIVNFANSSTNLFNNQTKFRETSEHVSHEGDSLILYIILGVLLGILLLISIALFIFYKHKKCHQGSGDYYVTQLKDISTSSTKESSNVDSINMKL